MALISYATAKEADREYQEANTALFRKSDGDYSTFNFDAFFHFFLLAQVDKSKLQNYLVVISRIPSSITLL